MPIAHKRGDTFSRAGQFMVTADGLNMDDMTGWTGRCQVRSQAGVLVQELTFTWLNPVDRLFKLEATAAQTAAWPLGTHRFDIELTTPAGQRVTGPTDRLILTGAETL